MRLQRESIGLRRARSSKLEESVFLAAVLWQRQGAIVWSRDL